MGPCETKNHPSQDAERALRPAVSLGPGGHRPAFCHSVSFHGFGGVQVTECTVCRVGGGFMQWCGHCHSPVLECPLGPACSQSLLPPAGSHTGPGSPELCLFYMLWKILIRVITVSGAWCPQRAATLGQSPASSSARLPACTTRPESELASLSLPPQSVSRPTPTASVRPLLQNWVTRWHLCCSQASLVPPPMARALGARSGRVKTLRVVGLGTPRSHTHLPRQPGGGQPCECAQCPQTTHLHVAEGGDFMPCVLHRDKKYF